MGVAATLPEFHEWTLSVMMRHLNIVLLDLSYSRLAGTSLTVITEMF